MDRVYQLFFFFLGGQGGLVFTLWYERELLASPHALTGLAGLLLLAGEAALGTVMKTSENEAALRATHAYLGTSIMALFMAHSVLGLINGLSF